MMQGLLSFGKSIREFKNTSNQPIFPQATTYPAFFDKHLVHPSRRIKALINDPNANIRAFYFQYLMLCYQIQNQNYEFYISKIKKFLMDPNFTFLFLEEDDQKIFNDRQFKRFLLEFMEILDSGEFDTTEIALNTYPIADVVFVYFFRSLAIYAEITSDFDSYIDKTNLFGFLLENFNIDAQIFQQKCIKFIQAEVFVYQQSSTQVYLVYKDIQQSMSQSNHSQTSHQKKSFQSMVDSKKQDKQQVQQNISMLEQQQSKSNDQNYQQQQDGGFKKNKILDNQIVYKKITDQFQQKPSVFSCNDQFDSHIEQNSQRIQYSFKASQPPSSNILNNSTNSYKSTTNNPNPNPYINSSTSEYQPQPKQPQISSTTKPLKQNENQGASLLTTHATPLSQYGFIQPHHQSPMESQINTFSNLNNSNNISNRKSQYNFGGIQEYTFKTRVVQKKQTQYSKEIKQNPQLKTDQFSQIPSTITATATTTTTKTFNSNKPNFDEFNHDINLTVINRDKTTYSHTDAYNSSINPKGESSVNYRQMQTPAKGTNVNSYPSIIPHINTHLHPNPNSTTTQQFSKLPPTPMHFQKLHVFPQVSLPKPYHAPTLSPFTHGVQHESSTHISSNYQLNTNSITNSKGYIPATRDVPTHDTYLFPNGAKNSGMSAYASSRQSLTVGLTNKQITKQSQTQSKTSLYFDNLIPFDQKHNLTNPDQNPKKSQTKFDPQITLYNPTKQKQPITLKPNPQLSILPTFKISETQKRDLRQQSISNKQRLKEMVTSKLSVSKEFTDSLTLLKMGEPYSSNIKRMKTRSREFRQSILNTIL